MQEDCTDLCACEYGLVTADQISCQVLFLRPLTTLDLDTASELLLFKCKCLKHDGMEDVSEIQWDL